MHLYPRLKYVMLSLFCHTSCQTATKWIFRQVTLLWENKNTGTLGFGGHRLIQTGKQQLSCIVYTLFLDNCKVHHLFKLVPIDPSKTITDLCKTKLQKYSYKAKWALTFINILYSTLKTHFLLFKNKLSTTIIVFRID